MFVLQILLNMRKGLQPWFSRFLIFFTNACLFLLTLFLLVSEVSEQQPPIQGDITRANGAIDTLHTFPNAFVLGPGTIRITKMTQKMKYLAPRPVIDPMYALLFFVSAIIIVAFFWDFSYKKPFTKKALLGLQIGFLVLLVFAIANFFRYDWFYAQVKMITNGQFSFSRPMPLASPEFWILLVLIRLIRIFKKGVGLQKDIDLTV